MGMGAVENMASVMLGRGDVRTALSEEYKLCGGMEPRLKMAKASFCPS